MEGPGGRLLLVAADLRTGSAAFLEPVTEHLSAVPGVARAISGSSPPTRHRAAGGGPGAGLVGCACDDPAMEQRVSFKPSWRKRGQAPKYLGKRSEP